MRVRAMTAAAALPAVALVLGPATAPASSFAVRGQLNGVAALSARSAWAVGATGVCKPRTLIARWNGSAWKAVTVPAAIRQGDLIGVAATSPRNAWAVGFSGPLIGPRRSLLLRWNGTAWASVVHPGAAAGVTLDGVAATSARHAWAVGYTGRGKTFMVRWDGHAWRRVPIPSPRGFSLLADVAATSVRNVWAVGATLGRSGTVLILHWNGAAWTRFLVPGLPAGSVLNSVVATSAGNAWAAGLTGGDKTLILRWNGTAWRQVAGLSVTGGLIGLAAVSGRDVWAVGGTVTEVIVGCPGPAASAPLPGTGVRLPGTGVRLPAPAGRLAATKVRPIIAHWNGTTWKQVTSPDPLSGAVLDWVAATSAGNAWAVGAFHYFQQNAKVLVLRWNGRVWK